MLTEDYFKRKSALQPKDKPPYWTILGDEYDLARIPLHHREQMLFLNEEACDFAYRYINDLNLLNDQLWQPFEHLYCSTIEKYTTDANNQAFKKWLYQRGIAFSTWILVIPNYNSYPMLMTWKMLLKYAEDIFSQSDDYLLMDCSQRWYLFYYHEGEATFIS